LIGPSQGNFLKIETSRAPQNIFLCENVMPSLWPNYISEKVRTLGKPYTIKLRIVNM
jgi:hypothetical protein